MLEGGVQRSGNRVRINVQLIHAADTLDVVPKDLLAYTEKHLPKFLSAPTEDYGPSLSSIENFARTQTPAPALK